MSTLTQTETKAQILVIEDERSISIAMEDLLDSYGYPVQSAMNAEAGIKALGRNPLIDIVLLDYNLGTGMNGLEAIPLIKEKSPHVQIIMLTSQEDVHLGVDCIKAGAFEYLTKPFEEDKFFEIVPRALEKKKLSQMNQLYLGILVHDMHNPLSNIKLGWEYFKETAQDLSLTPKHENILSAMEIGIWEIRHMIHNIISVSKFEQGHVSANNQKFLIHEAIAEDLKIFSGWKDLAQKGIEVKILLNEGANLTTDREFFRQVLLNLVNNSLRYCPEEKSVEVKVEAPSPETIQVSVSNPGSYIEESFRNQVFEKYFHGNFSTPFEGNKNFGMGLTYSRLAVEAMGGTIWINSQKDPMQTTFYFTVRNRES